jgi:adenosylcobinamide-phosphate guanylyltransferase
MAVTALVMAGGKGTRLGLAEEKPLVRLGGKPVIALVLSALEKAKSVDAVVVAVSPNTPKTADFLKKQNVKVLQTSGKEYVSDMDFAVKTLGLETVLAVGADLPLLTGEVVDQIVEYFSRCGKPALAVAVPEETREKLGLGHGFAFNWCGKRLVYAGVNVLDGKRIEEAELEQAVYVMDNIEVAVNINTVDELWIAEEQFNKFYRR